MANVTAERSDQDEDEVNVIQVVEVGYGTNNDVDLSHLLDNPSDELPPSEPLDQDQWMGNVFDDDEVFRSVCGVQAAGEDEFFAVTTTTIPMMQHSQPTMNSPNSANSFYVKPEAEGVSIKQQAEFVSIKWEAEDEPHHGILHVVVCKEEVYPEQERSHSLLQEEPETLHVKDVQEDLFQSPEEPIVSTLTLVAEQIDDEANISSCRFEVDSDGEVTEDSDDWEETSEDLDKRRRDKSFAGSGPPKKRQHVHSGRKPFHYEHCDESFSQLSVLKAHNRVHNAKTNFAEQARSPSLLQEEPREQIKKPEEPVESTLSTLAVKGKEQNNGDMEGEKDDDDDDISSHSFEVELDSDSEVTDSDEREEASEGHDDKRCDKGFTKSKKVKLVHQHSKKSVSQSSNLNARKHIPTVEKPFHCQHCGESFSQSGSLSDHLRRVHFGVPNTHQPVQEKMFRCELCGKSFSASRHLSNHIRVHALKPFRCQHCDKSFRESGSLKRHQFVHTGDALFQCKHCNKGFSTPRHLKAHERIHAGKKTFADQESSPGLLQEEPEPPHIKEKKVELLQRADKPVRSTLAIMTVKQDQNDNGDDTSKSFSQSDSLSRDQTPGTRHRKPFKCDHCDERFTQLSALKTHQVVHTREKKIQCKRCVRSFRFLSSLVAHRASHTRGKPFQCIQCDMSFSRRESLKRHRLAHAREKKIQCKHCDRSFSWLSSLEAHQAIHT